MNYRHAYHAGSFADVLKHAALTLVIEHLKAKAAPFMVLDTHAGMGRYDLTSDEARKTGEAEAGIVRVLAAVPPPEGTGPYLAAVRRANRGLPGLQWYPGSPKLARALIRPGDRLVLYELHPEDARALARAFAGDPAVEVHARDGWSGLKSALPPPERRGMVLIDPAYEVPDEFDRLMNALRAGHRRWATGVYLLWYPIKDAGAVAKFKTDLAASGIPRILVAELHVPPRGEGREGLAGSGLVVVNPPWHLDVALAALIRDLPAALGIARHPRSGVSFLAPE